MGLIQIAALVFLTTSLPGNTPHATVNWRSFRAVSNPGDDRLMACERSSDGDYYRALVFTGGEEFKEWSLVTLDRYGEPLSREVIFVATPSSDFWMTPCFLDSETLVTAYGTRYSGGPAALRIYAASDISSYREVEITGSLGDYHGILLTAVVPMENGNLLIAGRVTDQEYVARLFTAEIGMDGVVEWYSEIPGTDYIQLEDTAITVLEDGSIMLTYEEDCFPAGVLLIRLDNRGSEMWRQFVELECEFSAGCRGFIEFDQDRILCFGGYDLMGQMVFRGLLTMVDRTVTQLWERTELVNHHTAFDLGFLTESGELLVIGWTAFEGQMPFQVDDMDVVFYFVEPDHGEAVSYCVTSQGDQRARCVFTGGIGEFFVVGEHRENQNGDNDIFLGRLVIQR